ncbi:hypothetical protein Tco_0792290 [Tanacetum coccineum]
MSTFIPMETEDREGASELAAGSSQATIIDSAKVGRSKRAAEAELDHEGSKRQKANKSPGSVQEQPEEEKKELSQEDLQQMIMVVPVEEVYVEALQVKYPIIDWEDDLVMLWNLVKERFSSTEPTDDKERALWVELKSLDQQVETEPVAFDLGFNKISNRSVTLKASQKAMGGRTVKDDGYNCLHPVNAAKHLYLCCLNELNTAGTCALLVVEVYAAKQELSTISFILSTAYEYLVLFAYECDFMILEDTTSIIDRHLGEMAFGRSFIDETGPVYNREEGMVMFKQDDKKITFKMPHTMEIFNQTRLMGLSTDSIPPSAYEENFSHGRTHYYQSLLIGDEYMQDGGDRRGIRHLMRLEKEIMGDKDEVT